MLKENNVLDKILIQSKQALLNENFDEFIKLLYELGLFLEKDFSQDNFIQYSDFKERKKYFFTFIQNKINNFSPSIPQENNIKKLNTRLWNLQSFLIAWEDPGLRDLTRKRERQNIKLKKISIYLIEKRYMLD